MRKCLFSVRCLFVSWRATLILLAIYAVLLAMATLIEKVQGTSVARELIYNQPLFYFLQLLMVLQFIAVGIHKRLWRQRKYGIVLLHVAFIVILAGALVTNMFGFEGIIHIREGETTSVLHQQEGIRKLPFSLRLDDFNLVRYPGSHSPSSFESFLTVFSDDGARIEHIYMNKVIYEQGYRLYQSSYDTDELGTILSVNHDNWGTGITYLGYLLLLVGILLSLLDSNSHVRWLVRQLKKTVPILLFCYFPMFLFAQENITGHLYESTIPVTQAEMWGRMQIQCSTGRVEPINTYTSKLLRKIYRNDNFKGLRPEQVILGFLINPEYWGNVPLIRQTNVELAEKLALPSDKYLKFFDLFDEEGQYIIAEAVDSAYSHPVAERSRTEKDLLKLDERVNILYSLQQGRMFALFPLPDDRNGKWYSPNDDLSLFSGKDSMFVSKIFYWYIDEVVRALDTQDWAQANEVLSMINVYQQRRSSVGLLTDKQVAWELFYNRADLFFLSAIGYMGVGLLLLLFSVWCLLKSKRWLRTVTVVLMVAIIALFLLHTFGIGVRWYISGRAPWANAYESMIYVAWATALAGLLFIRRSFMTLALAAFFAGIILFVANLNFMDPEITPLVPVLKSYWLMIHVAVITASYGFFGMSFFLGLLSLGFMAVGERSAILQIHIRELRFINEISLYIGLYLLTAGIFLGAVWANESWGRYWGWDPKETWALITMIVYAFVLHARFIPSLRSDYVFSIMSVFALSSVLMTYFGVNYYLSGLHSYGSGDVPPGLHIIFFVFSVILLLAFYIGYKQRKLGERTL